MTIFSNLNRRDFLKISGTGVVSFVAGQVLSLHPVQSAGLQKGVYPLVDIGPLSGLQVGGAVGFHYPDEDSPAIMLHLTETAKDGVGPTGSVVAYSTLCTHKGCPVQFHPERKMLICPCHWSTFDVAKAGGVVIGQASQSLPQIKLRIEGGRIQAYGVDGLIYGRHTNIL
mgnify:CR=1 FL=1